MGFSDWWNEKATYRRGPMFMAVLFTGLYAIIASHWYALQPTGDVSTLIGITALTGFGFAWISLTLAQVTEPQERSLLSIAQAEGYTP